jgi:hypothetical protein
VEGDPEHDYAEHNGQQNRHHKDELKERLASLGAGAGTGLFTPGPGFDTHFR